MGHYEQEDRLVMAIWKASQVPLYKRELAYYRYEGADNAAQSDYHYWYNSGLAGCLIKPNIRTKLGLGGLSSVELSHLAFRKKQDES